MAKSLTITLSNRSIGSVSISNRAIGSVTLVDVVGEAGFDADAQTFFNAGTFNDSLKTAYNTFFLNLKTGLTNGTDLFTNAVGFYLFTSGTAADNAINAKNPSTVGTFYNSPTHAASGVTFNGTTQYFDTGINANTSLSLNDVSFSVYQSNDVDELSIHGCRDATNFFHLIPHLSSNFNARIFTIGNTAAASSSGAGLFTGVRRGATENELYENGTSLGGDNDVSSAKPNYNVFIGARNNAGSAEFFVGNEVRFAYLGAALSDNQVVDLNASVTQLFKDLYVTDADALSFINSAGITSATLMQAYNTFFTNLKTGLTNATNVYSDLIALYILTSGDASANAVNAKNPGTFDLTFVNSPTHASTGVTFNGSSQYARTSIIPNSHLTEDDVTLSAYFTNNMNAGIWGCTDGNNSTNTLDQIPRLSGQTYFDSYSVTTGRANTALADCSGLMTSTRRTSTDVEIYRNASSVFTKVQNSGGVQPAVQDIWLGAYNSNGSGNFYISNEIRVTMIGNGLTDNQVADWSAAVTQLFTDLGI